MCQILTDMIHKITTIFLIWSIIFKSIKTMENKCVKNWLSTSRPNKHLLYSNHIRFGAHQLFLNTMCASTFQKQGPSVLMTICIFSPFLLISSRYKRCMSSRNICISYLNIQLTSFHLFLWLRVQNNIEISKTSLLIINKIPLQFFYYSKNLQFCHNRQALVYDGAKSWEVHCKSEIVLTQNIEYL